MFYTLLFGLINVRGRVPLDHAFSSMLSLLLTIIVIVRIAEVHIPAQIAHIVCTYYRLRI